MITILNFINLNHINSVSGREVSGQNVSQHMPPDNMQSTIYQGDDDNNPPLAAGYGARQKTARASSSDQHIIDVIGQTVARETERIKKELSDTELKYIK